MFGTKDAGLLESLLRFRHRPAAAKQTRVEAEAVDALRETPIDVIVRKETYFAMSRSSRWNQ